MVRRVASDLLTIEVNTIIKPGMTARKMPPPPIALHDIAENYTDYVERLAVGPRAALLPDGVHRIEPSKRTNGHDAFSEILGACERMQKGLTEEGAEGTTSKINGTRSSCS